MEFSNVTVSVNNDQYIVATLYFVSNGRYNTVFVISSGYGQYKYHTNSLIFLFTINHILVVFDVNNYIRHVS